MKNPIMSTATATVVEHANEDMTTANNEWIDKLEAEYEAREAYATACQI